jgi:type 1 fimbria pilin
MTWLFLKRTWIRMAVLFASATVWSTAARADCATPALPYSFDYAAVAVPNALDVGSVIPGTERPFRLVGTCTASNTFSKDVVACPSSAQVAGMTGVYPTGLAGVGMRMRNSGGVPLVGTSNCSTSSSLGKTDSTGKFDVSGTFELVKTGTVSVGTIGAASYNTGVLDSGVTLNGGQNTISVRSSTPFRVVTCSVLRGSENQTIRLPTVRIESLATPGQTTGETPFQIKMSCAPGVKVNITLQSVSGDSGVSSVLGSTGTSSGVGIQVLDATHAAIVLNEIRNVIDTTTGDATIYFYAQYYRLAAAIKAGPVNAAAIYTMSYQ